MMRAHDINVILCWARQGNEPWRRALLRQLMAKVRTVARLALREHPELLKNYRKYLCDPFLTGQVATALHLLHAADWVVGDEDRNAPLAAVILALLLALALGLLEASQERHEPERSPPRPPPLIQLPKIQINGPNL